jgi:hypothetical protein
MNPMIGKEIINNIRYQIGMAIEVDGFYSSRVQKLLKQLKSTKDSYDIACLRKIDPAKIDQLIEKELAKYY